MDSNDIYRRIVRQQIKLEVQMPRKRRPMLETAIAANPKYPVNTTVDLPWDLRQEIDEFCRATGARRYELFIAGVYTLLRREGYLEEDPSLELYVKQVTRLIDHARQSNRLGGRGGLAGVPTGPQHQHDPESDGGAAADAQNEMAADGVPGWGNTPQPTPDVDE